MISKNKVNAARALKYISIFLAIAQGIYYLKEQPVVASCLIVGGIVMIPVVFKKVIETYNWIHAPSLNLMCHIVIIAALIKVIAAE